MTCSVLEIPKGFIEAWYHNDWNQSRLTYRIQPDKSFISQSVLRQDIFWWVQGFKWSVLLWRSGNRYFIDFHEPSRLTLFKLTWL